jgi:folate-binding protein YgfZ
MSEALELSSMPANYGDPVAEYAAVRDRGAGLLDLSARGRIQLSGSEAVPFLNGLISNDVKALQPGSWMNAAFPNVQGRLLAAVRILNRGEHFLIDTEQATHAKVWALLERFTLAGDFHITDVTSQTGLISVQGAAAGAVIRQTLGESVSAVERERIATQTSEGEEVSVIRATHTGEDGFDIFANAVHSRSLWDAFRISNAQPVGVEALEVLRIEAGLPCYGIDMDETTILSETNLEDAVSFTKGCYIGQEIIARIKYRGHVAKKLTGLGFTEKIELSQGAKVMVAERDAGRITSVIWSPRLERTIALGYVKYDFLAPGTSVRVIQDAIEHAAEVTELPFVRGSWYAGSES